MTISDNQNDILMVYSCITSRIDPPPLFFWFLSIATRINQNSTSFSAIPVILARSADQLLTAWHSNTRASNEKSEPTMFLSVLNLVNIHRQTTPNVYCYVRMTEIGDSGSKKCVIRSSFPWDCHSSEHFLLVMWNNADIWRSHRIFIIRRREIK